MRPERDRLEIQFPRVEGYRVELPNERLTAEFNEDSTLELTPDLVGPSITQNAGIIGEDVDLNLEHPGRYAPINAAVPSDHSGCCITNYRDPDEDPELHLFGQLKRITKQWLDNYLVCKGGTYPAQLMYQELADMACDRIHAGITRRFEGEQPIRAVLDPYNPTGSSMHVNFYTSKAKPLADRLPQMPRQLGGAGQRLGRPSSAGWWNRHPRVQAYVKNQGLGLEVPYRYGSNMRKYIPDFIVQIDDGQARSA